MTTLIKNVSVIDGSGKPAVKADVLLKRDKIAAIGSFSRYKADKIIDGLGAYVSPGFIDTNNNADLYLNLFHNPGMEETLGQGITTIIGGQNGISLAPLIYGTLDLHKFWAAVSRLNFNWHSMSDFLRVMGRKHLAVNFGTFVGYSSIREAVAGSDFRDLTAKEADVIKHVVEKSLKGGAYGVSFDLAFPLTSLTPYKELKTLLEVAEKHKAAASFRLRSGSDMTVISKNGKDNFIPAVNEIINLAQETSVKVWINNFSCLKGFEKEYGQVLDLISENSASADVSFNVNLAGESLVPIFSFLPQWAQRGKLSDVAENLKKDSDFASKVKKEIPVIKAEEIGIFRAPGFEHIAGKSLKDFCEARDLSAKEGILELMKTTKLRAVLSYRNISPAPLLKALNNEHSLVATADAGFKSDYYGNDVLGEREVFPKFLQLAVNDKVMSIEKAVKKITGFPAKQLGLKNRGMIKENYFADLTIFRDGKIEIVIVNGKVAWEDGKRTGTLNGKTLTHKVN